MTLSLLFLRTPWVSRASGSGRMWMFRQLHSIDIASRFKISLSLWQRYLCRETPWTSQTCKRHSLPVCRPSRHVPSSERVPTSHLDRGDGFDAIGTLGPADRMQSSTASRIASRSPKRTQGSTFPWTGVSYPSRSRASFMSTAQSSPITLAFVSFSLSSNPAPPEVLAY